MEAIEASTRQPSANQIKLLLSDMVLHAEILEVEAKEPKEVVTEAVFEVFIAVEAVVILMGRLEFTVFHCCGSLNPIEPDCPLKSETC